jgi:MFS family permease
MSSESLGLFLGPINVDLGVSASAFGFAMALQNIVWGISQPFVGMLGDRYGARPVLIGSAIVYTAGLLLMAAGIKAGGAAAVQGQCAFRTRFQNLFPASPKLVGGSTQL